MIDLDAYVLQALHDEFPEKKYAINSKQKIIRHFDNYPYGKEVGHYFIRENKIYVVRIDGE